jgi:hypothetical protein
VSGGGWGLQIHVPPSCTRSCTIAWCHLSDMMTLSLKMAAYSRAMKSAVGYIRYLKNGHIIVLLCRYGAGFTGGCGRVLVRPTPGAVLARATHSPPACIEMPLCSHLPFSIYTLSDLSNFPFRHLPVQGPRVFDEAAMEAAEIEAAKPKPKHEEWMTALPDRQLGFDPMSGKVQRCRCISDKPMMLSLSRISSV